MGAQTRVSGGGFNVVPREFSATNRPLLHFVDEGVVSLYNDDIEKVAEVAINNRKFEYTLSYAEQTREVKAVTHVLLKEDLIRTFDAVNTFEQYVANERQLGGPDFRMEQRLLDDGRTMLYGYYDWMGSSMFFAYDYFGNQYPRNYLIYDPANLTLTQQVVSYNVEYTDWVAQPAQDVTQTVDLDILKLRYRNLDADVCHDGGDFVVSQTLFDSDGDYEYIVPKIRLSETANAPQDVVIDFDSGTSTNESIVLRQATCLTQARYPVVSGFSIVSSDGSISHDIDLGEGYALASQDELLIITLGGKTYLAAECWDEGSTEPESCFVFYRIDTATRGLQRANVASCRMNVVQESRSLHINLPDTDSASRILVIDSAGRTIAQADIAAGQRSTTINIASPSGTYDIIRLQGGVRTHSTKTIIH